MVAVRIALAIAHQRVVGVDINIVSLATADPSSQWPSMLCRPIIRSLTPERQVLSNEVQTGT
jgi:hypothetical protein